VCPHTFHNIKSQLDALFQQTLKEQFESKSTMNTLFFFCINLNFLENFVLIFLITKFFKETRFYSTKASDRDVSF